MAARSICPVFYNLEDGKFGKLYVLIITEGTKKSIDSDVFLALVFVRFHFISGYMVSLVTFPQVLDVNVTS